MIGTTVKFTANGLQSLPWVEDKSYRVLDAGFLQWIDSETRNLIHSLENITHIFLENIGLVHVDHLNLSL